ncbi:MAG: APC family permease [Gammaproteobacteria bacterium]|nr:APC family permease [Gammaproteobacteria bacterium]
MKRSISTFGLLLTSISATIGSGWLFSAYYTAAIAGPAASLSWIIGGLFVIIVAFAFAEICAMLPISGSSARIPQYTHGTVVSFMFSWMIWLSYLSVMTVEVQAVIQYASFYIPNMIKSNGGLTHPGYLAATILMLIITIINTYSIRWLIRCNNILTLIKVIIPIIIVITILIDYFTPAHVLHAANSGFMPNGVKSVLGAISTGGIIFAFNGFKQAAEMAGDAKNPGRSVPLAIVGSVCICLILFLLIQFAFFSSLTLENLTSGWSNIQLPHHNSPLASIIQQDHLPALLPLLYFAAVIAPLAAGLMYCSSAGRSLYGMSKNGYLPRFFQHICPQGNPRNAILVNFILGMCLFAPLPGWENMVSFLTSLLAITYAVGPICLLALRSQAADQKRPLRLPFVHLWAFISFYICTLLAYWSGWAILSKMGIAIIVGFLVLMIYRFCTARSISLNFKESIWMWPYFIGIMLISYLGNYGGKNILTLSSSLIVLAIFCLIILWLAMRFKLPPACTQKYINELHLERDEIA